MARADAGAGVAVKVLVEEDEVLPVRVVVELLGATVDRPAAGASRRKVRLRRSPSSWATSNSVMSCPEPVGHSTLKSSP